MSMLSPCPHGRTGFCLVCSTMPPAPARGLLPERFRFGPKHICDMTEPVVFRVSPQLVTRVSSLIVPRFGWFFEIVRFEIGRNTVVGLNGPQSAGIFREGSELSKFHETISIGQVITLEAVRAQTFCRLAMTLREGAEVPARWRDAPLPIQRLHPKCPRQSGEVEIAYDWSWPIPSWVVARIADLEKPLGAPLEEPEVDQTLLENLKFDAYATGVSIGG